MESEPIVLVASPTYYGMKYCFRKFINTVKNLDYMNYDVLIVDNSKNNDFFKELKKEQEIIALKYDSQEKTSLKRLVDSRNMILKYAKDKEYDFLLMMDSDVIPPKNIISELMNHNKDVISGLYDNYFMVDGKAKLLPAAWIYFTEDEFQELKKKYPLPESAKTRFDVRRHITKEEADSNLVFEAMYPSAGCMLISRACFLACKYGILEMPDNIITSDDIYFIEDARKKGFRIYVNTAVKCEHVLEGKFERDSGGNLLHPLYKG